MGEDTLIYVKKNQAKDLYFTAMRIEQNFGNRWYSFKQKFYLNDYPKRGYFIPEEILSAIAGKKVKEIDVSIIKDLIGKDCIIMGDCLDFPKDKNQDDYIQLTIFFYILWSDYFKEVE